MQPEPDTAVTRAKQASGEELRSLLHDAREEVLLALLENPQIAEPELTILLERLDLPSAVVGTIAEKGDWISRQPLKLRVARHPHAPKKIAIAILRQLYPFDLARLSTVPSAPPDVRRLAEEILIARVPQLALGEKLTLARRAPARVAGALLGEGHPHVMRVVLENPLLTESQVLKVLAKLGVPERIVSAIANHAKWSSRRDVTLALLRNRETPVSAARQFVPKLALDDLKEIVALSDLAPHLRQCIVEEYARRSPETGRDSIGFPEVAPQKELGKNG